MAAAEQCLSIFDPKTSKLPVPLGPSHHIVADTSSQDIFRRFICLAKDWNPIEKLNFWWRKLGKGLFAPHAVATLDRSASALPAPLAPICHCSSINHTPCGHYEPSHAKIGHVMVEILRSLHSQQQQTMLPSHHHKP